MFVTVGKRLEARYGFRATRLLIFGTLWALIGIFTITSPLPPRPGYDLVLHELVPPWIRGLVWIATGLYAIAAAVRPHRDPEKPRDDGWAWAALTVMPTVRLIGFGFAWAAWLVWWVVALVATWLGHSVPPIGYPEAISGALLYLVILALVSSSAHHHCAATAGLPSPPPLPSRRPKGRR